MGKILVILSSCGQLQLQDGKTHETGFFLNEFGVPARRLADEGYQLVLANPQGNVPPMDPSSDDDSFFDKDAGKHAAIKSFVQELLGKSPPRPFREILSGGLDQFDGLFVPGGHAPMIDLFQDRELGQILRHFHERKKPTALICHGPAALLSTLPDPAAFAAALERDEEIPEQRDWPYLGYSMTVLSNIEEKLGESKFPAKMRFYAETALKKAGARMDVAMIPMQSHVVKHEELVTGQNPKSDDALAQAFLSMLALRTATARR